MIPESRDWRREAEAYLNEYYAQVCSALDSRPADTLKIAPAIEDEEAAYLMNGFGDGLFSIDEAGYIQSALLPPAAAGSGKQKMLQLFWRTSAGRVLFREGVCQLATVASLIYKYGWHPEEITMEPGIGEFGGLAYGVDILIRNKKRNLVICGEVKKDRAEFNKLVEGFRHCCQRGPHSKDQCAFGKNHPKYEFCNAIRPSHFFAAAPGLKTCFRLEYSPQISIKKEEADLIYASGP